MKKIFVAMTTLLLIAGCSSPSANTNQTTKFAVYLSDTNEVVFSEDDIVSYNNSTDTFTFTKDGVKKIQSYQSTSTIQGGLYQKPFTVKIGDEAIYTGKFWTSLSSLSEDGIVMLDTFTVSPENNTLTVIGGYPERTTVTDEEKEQIDDARITEHFQKLDKLTSTPPKQTLTSNQQIQNLLQQNEEVVVTKDPNLILPEDIQATQIKGYFQGGDMFFALVQDDHKDVPFTGILIAHKNDKTWKKYAEIKDAKSPSIGNNPYYLWKTDQNLSVSIVDKNGAGSGEGFMKVLTFNNNEWKQTGCYYYPSPNCATEEECFALSKNLDKYRAVTSANPEEYAYCQVEFVPFEPQLK